MALSWTDKVNNVDDIDAGDVNALAHSIQQLESDKVDKIEGKTLTSNDFTDTDKAKLDGLENYNDTAVKALIANKVDKVDGMGLCNANFVDMIVYKDETAATIGVRKNSDGVLITYEDFYTKKGTNEKLSGKQDKAVYYNPTTGNAITYDLKNEHNRMTTYIGADAATSVTISVSDGAYRNDYISGLSFYTGSTPPEVSYPSSPYTMRWIGSECTTSGESSVFSPIANRVYDIIFYFNGGYIIGLVNGYDDIPQQGA